MFRLRAFESGDAGWVIGEHARHYAGTDGFDASFEALVRAVMGDFLHRRDSALDRGWIAERHGARMGSIFCMRDDAMTARLRLFLVLAEARGQGLGRQLLAALTEHARDRGCRRIRVFTHESHAAAAALYAASGFALISSRPVRNFGQALVEQKWEKPL